MAGDLSCSEAINELARTFFRIPQLPQLETINLKFNPVDDNQTNSDGEDRLSLQSSILGILHASFSVRGPSKLKSLSLLNIRASNPSPLEILQLQNIFPSLQCLQLSAVSDKAPNSDTFRNRWRYFWRTLRSCMVPIQTQIILTELTLHSDRFVGSVDSLSLRELHFPHLAVLSLRNIVFNPVRDDEFFILRHATTLFRLKLLTCKVLISIDRYPAPAQSIYINLAGDVEMSLRRHWDRIWDRFTADLTAVVTLNVDEGHKGREVRYVHPGINYRIGGSYSMIYAVESRNAADLAALQRFRMAVAARSTETRVES